MFNRLTWKEGEALAARYMKKAGYKIVYTNFSCVHVELDIVAILSKSAQKSKMKKEYLQKLEQERQISGAQKYAVHFVER